MSKQENLAKSKEEGGSTELLFSLQNATLEEGIVFVVEGVFS